MEHSYVLAIEQLLNVTVRVAGSVDLICCLLDQHQRVHTGQVTVQPVTHQCLVFCWMPKSR
jgi:hypothetical protein